LGLVIRGKRRRGRAGPARAGSVCRGALVRQESAGAVATARSIAAMSIFCIWNMACSAR
jgi:hypothetical protein